MARSCLTAFTVVFVVVTAVGTLGVTGCSRGRGAAAPEATPQTTLDPVGRYDYTSVANGQTITGTITISRAVSGLTGVMTTGVTRDLAFETVRVSGNRVTLESAVPPARAVELTVNGADVTGTWQMGAMGGSLKGKRLSGP